MGRRPRQARQRSQTLAAARCGSCEQYADLADSIKVNAKGEALKRALDRIFTVAARAPVAGEGGRLHRVASARRSTCSTCSPSTATRARSRCSPATPGTPEERRALVEEFRDQTQILLSTEAGAEGLNLQFCNLVVNYDLPWNPQRVEQRIGRCHRYGQQRDVLVHQLPQPPERGRRAAVRAAGEEAQPVRRRVRRVGRDPRRAGERRRLRAARARHLPVVPPARRRSTPPSTRCARTWSSRIDQRMTEARSLLIERFDGDVRRRLRMAGEQAKEALAQRQQAARRRSPARCWATGASGRRQVAKAAGEVRDRTHDAVTYLQLDASALPARLARLAGQRGLVVRLPVRAHGPQARGEARPPGAPARAGRRLPRAAARGRRALREAGGQGGEAPRSPPPVSVSLLQEQALLAAQGRAAPRRRAPQRAGARPGQGARGPLRRRLPARVARGGGAGARGTGRPRARRCSRAEEPAERVKARAHAERLEREYRKKLPRCATRKRSATRAKDRSWRRWRRRPR